MANGNLKGIAINHQKVCRKSKSCISNIKQSFNWQKNSPQNGKTDVVLSSNAEITEYTGKS